MIGNSDEEGARLVDPATHRYLAANPRPLDVGNGTDLLRHRFEGRYLSRPLFCSHAEAYQAYQDLVAAHRLIGGLAGRLFNGDHEEFAKALGLTPVQAEVVGRFPHQGPSPVFRADLIRAQAGFKLIELNAGSAIGGWEISDLYRLSLRDDAFANFFDAEKLQYVDPFASVAGAILECYGTEAAANPTMALIDWPDSYASQREALRLRAERFTELGIRTISGSVDGLDYVDGRVFLHGELVDIVYRLFMIDDIRDTKSAAELVPLFEAAQAGGVSIFTPLASEALGSKSALALLSDTRGRKAFSAEEEALVSRVVPWTRRVRPGETTDFEGRDVDLLDFVLRNRRDLVLKPSLRHSGLDVLPGWSPEVGQDTWERRVRKAVEGSYVVQQRVRPAPEWFPTADGGLVGSTVNWGVFGLPSGFAGFNIRAALNANAGVVNVSRGRAGCCFIFPDGAAPASPPMPGPSNRVTDR